MSEWTIKSYISNNGAFFNYKDQYVFDVWPDGLWNGDIGGEDLENDLDSVKEVLQSLRTAAKEYFGSDWKGEVQ